MTACFLITLTFNVYAECLVQRIPVTDGEESYITPVSTCKTIDCNKRYFFGAITYSQKTNTEYFGVKFYIGSTSQCLRVNILDPYNSFAGLLMCDGSEPVYHETNPLVIRNTKEGWCRLIVHNIGGIKQINSFHYNVGRYALPNANCQGE
jgi:hypothetical protein